MCIRDRTYALLVSTALAGKLIKLSNIHGRRLCQAAGCTSWMRLPQVSSKATTVAVPTSSGSLRNTTPADFRRVKSPWMSSVTKAVAGMPASNSAFWYSRAGGNAIGSSKSFDALRAFRRCHREPPILPCRHVSYLREPEEVRVEVQRALLVFDHDAGVLDLHENLRVGGPNKDSTDPATSRA